MCGRYTLTAPVESLAQLFGFDERPNLSARYNIAPTQEVPALRLDGAGALKLFQPRWGLIPSWAKDKSIAAKLINARGETVAEKPSFRSAFRQRRCLMLADGFYEWKAVKKDGKTLKQPYRVTLADGRPYAFAGLWESWRDPADGSIVETCCLITTEANARLQPIHHRMPVMLLAERAGAWLTAEGEAAQAMIAPLPDGAVVATAVSMAVNSVRNDGPELLTPAAPEPVQQSLI